MREWLKDIRVHKSKTQQQVAESAGLHQGYYSEIESGDKGKKLPVDTAKKIAEVLDFEWTKFYE